MRTQFPRAVVLLLVALAPALPAQRATIYRDSWGVPHIYAEREEDGWYALGYATAHDEMDWTLRITLAARGDAAAALGKEGLEYDIASRLWRHAAESKAGLARLSPELRLGYERWIQGFTRYMKEHPSEVPAWAPVLSAADLVGISRWLLWMAYQAGDGLAKCRASGAKLAQADIAALENRRVAASNEWVVSPWRTADSAMIVLSDPHGGVDGQFVYEFRIHAGRFEAAGYAMGAMPLLVQTRNVSWGMTTGAPSVADCYEVALEPGRTDRYLYDGKSLPIEKEVTRIPVKGGETVVRTMEYTRHNGVMSPVVARAEGKVWVVSTSYMHRAGDFDEEVYRMVLAKNVREVKEAMRIQGMFPQNVMVGDADGNSFYVRAGRTPKRPAGVDWRKALDGNSSKTAWLGIHPFEDLVQIENPPTGYMQNNNIGPDRMFDGSPLVRDRYPDYIYNDTPDRTNSRARRVLEVLSRSVRFSVDDAMQLALDEGWIDTETWKDVLRRSLDRAPDRVRNLTPDARQLADRILHFDGQAGSIRKPRWDSGTGGPRCSPSPARRAPWRYSTRAGSRTCRSPTTSVRRSSTPSTEPSRRWRKEGRSDAALGDVFRIGRPGERSFPLGGVGARAG
jgi:acyl-homoserine lactone acylase PvdQ